MSIDDNASVAVTDAKPSDKDLLDAFVENRSETAFAELCRRYERMILGVCSRRLGERADLATDALQVVLIILARKARSLGDVTIGGWLHKTATYVSANLLRHELRVEARHTDLAEIATREQDTQSRGGEWTMALRERLDEAISDLPEREKNAIVQFYFNGKSLDALAVETGCPRNTIRTRIYRAQRRLRGRLERRGIVLSLVALVAGLEAEGKELPIGDFRLPIGDGTEMPEGIRNTADAVMAEMDRAAAKAMWWKMGAVAAGLATIGVGTALVVSHLQPAVKAPNVAIQQPTESVAGVVVRSLPWPTCFGNWEAWHQGGSPRGYQWVGACPNGITSDGSNLWISSNSSTLPNLQPTLWKIDPLDGRVLGTLDLSGFVALSNSVRGVTWDGRNLWVVETQPDTSYMIRAIDPKTGVLVRSLTPPDREVRWIAWGNGALWDCNGIRILKINPKDGAVIRNIRISYSQSLPRPPTSGCCHFKGALWIVTDASMVGEATDFILKVDPETGMVLDRFPNPNQHALGICDDGVAKLWIMDVPQNIDNRMHGTNRLYLVESGEVASPGRIE